MTKDFNFRLARIAQEICYCDITDGFCTPEHKPDCKCWRYARLAIQGLRRQADPCLKDAWPTFTVDASRMMLIKLCDAILKPPAEREAMSAEARPPWTKR